MKISKSYLYIAGCFLIFLSVTAYITIDKAERKNSRVFTTHPVKATDNKEIIKFDHAFHSKDAGAQCKDCHNAAFTSEKATDRLLPKKDDCAKCHDVKDEKNCKQCHFDNVFKKLESAGKELNFSHKYHVTQGKQCTDCHAGIEKVKYAKESPGAYPSMEGCYSCHNRKTATLNCEACHTNLTNIKPKNHLSSNFLNEHKGVFEATNNSSNNCMMCHSDNFCQVCHTSGKFTGTNTPKNFYAPYYTKDGGTRMDRSALQKLTNMHSINYMYTHGLDANQKSFECKTCHDPVQFCASCHQNDGNTVTGIAPKSHKQPNFVTLGVNSGGGIHASLARKDIENCESCHAVEGGDPACVKCHFDNTGIRGTHPRTHERGFMTNEKGIWHNTHGAICYTCHTDPNARPNGTPGVGFCGYCHGSNPAGK